MVDEIKKTAQKNRAGNFARVSAGEKRLLVNITKCYRSIISTSPPQLSILSNTDIIQCQFVFGKSAIKLQNFSAANHDELRATGTLNAAGLRWDGVAV
jgi:hypothetical protein